jgi:hypothetical protein
MKTYAQNMIDRLKQLAANRCSAREATEILGGEWRAQGVASCPVCRAAGALRIWDSEDAGLVAFWCVKGCAQNAIAEAVGEILNGQGVDMYDRPPWVGDE